MSEIGEKSIAQEAGKSEKDLHSVQLIVFKLGQEEYGLHIDQIKEIVKTPPITRMPETPDYIKGVANIRGNIIAIADLENKFGVQVQQREGEDTGNFTLVIESEEFKLGVLVKEVPNTLAVSEGDIDDALNLVQENNNGDSGYIKGVVKLADRLIILIDIFKVLGEQDLNYVYRAVV